MPHRYKISEPTPDVPDEAGDADPEMPDNTETDA